MPRKNLTAKLADVEASLKRWQTRLKRATTKVTELDKLRRRYQLALLSEGQPVIATVKVKVPVEQTTRDLTPDEDQRMRAALRESSEKAEDPLKVPTFLKRDPNADALKAMNRRIEERAAKRGKKKDAPVKSRLLAKAIAENEQRNK